MKTLSVLAAALLSVFALAACGSGSDSGGGGTANAASSNDRDTARLKLQECLRKQGIDRGPGAGGGGGQGSPPSAAERQKLQKALQGPCKSVAQGAFGNQTDAQRQEFQDAFAKFASCMRAQGVEVPNFTPGQGPPAGGQRLNRDDPKVAAAMKVCQDKLPQGGRFGGGGGGGGGGASS
jgi:hypothetical protein